MKKFLLISVFAFFAFGNIWSEPFSIGFSCFDIDKAGTNEAIVGWITADSPAEKGGLKTGDKILEINGQDVQGLMFNKIRQILKSEKPTKFTFKVLRNGIELSLDATSVAASTLAGKSGTALDEKTVNPNLVAGKIHIATSLSTVIEKPQNIVDKKISIRIRPTGEEWWIYDAVYTLDNSNKFNAVTIPVMIDVSRTYYVELVYLNKDGLYHGDYIYKRGVDFTGSTSMTSLGTWKFFKRKTALPDVAELMKPELRVRGNVEFKLVRAAYDYYKNQGYVFPDKAQISILNGKGKTIWDKTVDVRYKWDAGTWMIYRDEAFFEAGKEPTESDLTFILTVNAVKNGKPETLSWKIREATYSSRSNVGSFLPARYMFTYWFDEKGQLTKVATK